MNYEMLREIWSAWRRSFTFLGFLVLLNLGLALYLSLWQRPELVKAQNEWFAKRDALKSGQSATVASSYQRSERDLEAFQQRVLAKKEFPRFLSQLYDTARANSLVLKGITYKPTAVKEAPLIAYGMSFTVAGRYASVKSFIADCARFHDMVTVDAISLSNQSQTEESVDLRVQMTLYLKQEGA